MKNVLYMLLGWTLGLLSPWLAEIIQRPYRRRQIKRGISIELRGLRAKLSSVTVQVAMNRGTLDLKLLQWFRNVAEGDEKYFRMTGDIPWDLVANATDDEIKAISRLNATPPTTALNFRRYSLPFIDSQLNSLSLFDLEFQRQIHSVRATLGIINEEIDVAWFYFQKTFDTLSETNRGVVQKNLVASHEFIGKTAHQLVNDISDALEA